VSCDSLLSQAVSDNKAIQQATIFDNVRIE
jgi:hypothetical protein